ncbi:MAG: phosphoribosyltransferase [Candidatus Aenigmarchaeota archaeon]|nr:phosphoribosyltransferase [Candidatus Aenigmarchaeota archaeon]
MRALVINRTKYFVLSWKDVERDVAKLAEQIFPKPTAIVGILKGGIIVARLLSDFLGVEKIRFLGLRYYKEIEKRKKGVEIYQPLTESLRGEDVLLVDDVADTGKSIEVGRQAIIILKPKSLKIATLYIKPHLKKKPDYFVRCLDGWIIYPWEKFESVRGILGKVSNKYTKKEIDKIIKKFE